MSLQEACEVLEDLLIRDLKVKEGILSNKEFTAVNKVLLELTVEGMYEQK